MKRLYVYKANGGCGKYAEVDEYLGTNDRIVNRRKQRTMLDGSSSAREASM